MNLPNFYDVPMMHALPVSLSLSAYKAKRWSSINYTVSKGGGGVCSLKVLYGALGKVLCSMGVMTGAWPINIMTVD